MYTTFYGLKEKPFSLLPDPQYLYLSKQHSMALELLEYSLINQAGFCVITGEIGAGKTTLIRRLLNLVDDRVTIGLLRNVGNDYSDLLRWILMAFGLDYSNKTKVELHRTFVDFIIGQYAQNRRTVLIVDEAQHMKVEALEELRMLSNINADKDQVVQVILAGQKELRDTLRRPDLAQFAQRIVVDYHLGPLTAEETRGYIRHRIEVAGGRPGLFEDDACQDVFELSGGIPRLINLLCDMALVYSYAEESRTITRKQVQDVVREREHGDLLPTFRWIAAASNNRKAKLDHKPEPQPHPRAPYSPERRKAWRAEVEQPAGSDTATPSAAPPSPATPEAAAPEAAVAPDTEAAAPEDGVAVTTEADANGTPLGERLQQSVAEQPPVAKSPEAQAEAPTRATQPAQTAPPVIAQAPISDRDLFISVDSRLAPKAEASKSGPAQPPKTKPRARASARGATRERARPFAQIVAGIAILGLLGGAYYLQNHPETVSGEPADAAPAAQSTAPRTPDTRSTQVQPAATLATEQAAQAEAERKAQEARREQERQAQALAAKQAAEAEAARKAQEARREQERQAQALAAKQAAEAEAARKAQEARREQERQAQALAAEKAAEAEAAQRAAAEAAERERQAKRLAEQRAAQEQARRQAAERERRRQAEARAAEQARVAAAEERKRRAEAAERERQRQLAEAAEAEAARRAQIEAEALAEQQRREREARAAQLAAEETARPQAETAVQATSEEIAASEVTPAEPEGFSADPCKGLTARYLSTCR